MAKVPHGIETLLKISIAWVGCTNVTDDRRQTDGRTMTYSEHELEFTFPKNHIKSHKNAYANYSLSYDTSTKCLHVRFLANVNSSSCSLYVIGRPSVRFSVCLSVCRLSSVVCNAGAPYSGDWNFRQYFYAMWYLGHPWPLYKNFTEIVPGEPLRRGC